MRSRAFAFLKPHAMVSQAVVDAVADRFAEAGVAVDESVPVEIDPVYALDADDIKANGLCLDAE